MRPSATKITTIPKLEAPKKLDLTVTGVASTIHEQQPAPRASQVSMTSMNARPDNKKNKQVSFQYLGDCEAIENVEPGRPSVKCFK